ncbi:MAG: long-chain-fatty-acid--CoA ligase [Hyphomonadaceae bacterium]|nr:long-chain-fatty-acid--CoA ligase [Hyphomonadaceae bacterium]
MLQSLMQDVPLTLNLVRERVAFLYADKTVTTRTAAGIETASYQRLLERSARLADALRRLGVQPGDRVATLAWNSQRHLELYLAVPCMGAVLHTINARLSGEAVAALLGHAGDRILFLEASLLSVLQTARLPAAVHHVVVISSEPGDGPDGGMADQLPGVTVIDYEALLGAAPSEFAWPELDERMPSGLCYTSGTTGTPKGVLYSHRSATLHTLACLFADGIAMRERDVCMPVVPMFHASAWGFPYAALMAGAALALPCRQTDWESLAALIEAGGVTMATAVPTVWLEFLEALKTGRIARQRIKSLTRIPMGGAAVTKALIDGFADFGIEVTHCWGMTEISPLGLVNVRTSALSEAEAAAARSAQGLPIPGCALRIMSPDGREAPRDGATPGELQIRSPWAADAYFDAGAPGNRSTEPGAVEAFVGDGRGRRWLRTGDVATIDRHGYVRIVDRTKDLIKSGGEWISSQALEAKLLEHPDVREAAVVARVDPKWQERPVAFVTLGSAAAAAGQDRLIGDLRRSLAAVFAKWQLPDAFIVLAELPKGSTGKIDKIALRAQLRAGPAASA